MTRHGQADVGIRSQGAARNRGEGLLRRGQPRLAAWGDKLYLGTLDGRLIALDREDRQVWSTVTVDQTKPYTITGAPRVINGRCDRQRRRGNGRARLYHRL
jgi:outer membrane protein assembly factor BamB